MELKFGLVGATWVFGWDLFWRCANPTTRPWKRLEHPESPWKTREKQLGNPGMFLYSNCSSRLEVDSPPFFRSCFFSKFSVDGGEQNLEWFDFCFQCIYVYICDISMRLSKLMVDCLMAFLASHGSNASFKPTSWLKSGGFCQWKHVLFGKPRLKILKFRVSKYDWIECEDSFVQLGWLLFGNV